MSSWCWVDDRLGVAWSHGGNGPGLRVEQVRRRLQQPQLQVRGARGWEDDDYFYIIPKSIIKTAKIIN